jgi:UDP:flavonoid glycosyltransferase YjiC (YdhE family)
LGILALPELAGSPTVGAGVAAMAGPGRPAPGRAAPPEVHRTRFVGRPAQRHSRPARPLAAHLDRRLCASPPLSLVATAQPFDYPHPDWDDSIQLIGACSYDPAPSTVPAWLARIDRPIVLASTSSEEQGDFELARTALAALAEEPVHVVATFPAGVPAGITAPANATVCEFVPHTLVLDRAACAITHGGMGVTQKALTGGTGMRGALRTRSIRGGPAGASREVRYPGASQRPHPRRATRRFVRPWR